MKFKLYDIGDEPLEEPEPTQYELDIEAMFEQSRNEQEGARSIILAGFKKLWRGDTKVFDD